MVAARSLFLWLITRATLPACLTDHTACLLVLVLLPFYLYAYRRCTQSLWRPPADSWSRGCLSWAGMSPCSVRQGPTTLLNPSPLPPTHLLERACHRVAATSVAARPLQAYVTVCMLNLFA